MNGINQIRAVVVATSPDDPAQIIRAALTLHRHDCFEAAIVGCAPRSVVEALPSIPATAGGLMSGIAAGRRIERRRDTTQRLYEKTAEGLAAIPEAERPELAYIEGAYLEIVATLSATFDLMVVPHPIEVPTFRGLCFPNFVTCLGLSKPAPTLFAVEPSGWHRIIVAQIEGYESWWATQILSRMSGPLDLSVSPWFPEGLAHKESQPFGAKNPLLFSSSDGIHHLDIAAIPTDQQPNICLVIPASVIRSVFRFRKVRRVLRRWQGSCLVWP